MQQKNDPDKCFYQSLYESLKEESRISFSQENDGEPSIALSTSLSLLVNTTRKDQTLFRDSSLTRLANGKTLIERDRRKLADQLALAQQEREAIINTTLFRRRDENKRLA